MQEKKKKKITQPVAGRSPHLWCVGFVYFVLFKDHCKQQQADLDFDSSEELVI